MQTDRGNLIEGRKKYDKITYSKERGTVREMKATPQEAIRILQMKEGISLDTLAERAGLGNHSNIVRYMSGNIKIAVFQKIINNLGYEIVIRPINSVDTKDDIVIEDKEYIKKSRVNKEDGE